MALILRNNLSRPLTHDELDSNFIYLNIITWEKKNYTRGQYVVHAVSGTTYLYRCDNNHTDYVYTQNSDNFTETYLNGLTTVRIWTKIGGGGDGLSIVSGSYDGTDLILVQSDASEITIPLNIDSAVLTGGTLNEAFELILESSDGSDITIDLSPLVSAGDGIYTPEVPLITPMPEKVGGLEAGTLASDLDGNTFSKMFDLILFPTVTPDLTAPTKTFNKTNNTLYEIDEVITVDGLATFNRGSINEPWNGDAFQDYRSGLPSNYEFFYFTGGTINYSTPNGNTTTTSLTTSYNEPSYSILQGYQNWLSRVTYSNSTIQPLDNYGNNFSTPLTGGTLEAYFTIEGVYPIYATTYTGTFTSFPTLSSGFTGGEGITSQTKQPLASMITGDNIELILASEPNLTDRQTFWIPSAWLAVRPLIKVELYDTSSNQFSPTNFLSTFTESSTTIGGINYKQFEYNSTLRGFVKIRLKF
jgi:hypothetical protein